MYQSSEVDIDEILLTFEAYSKNKNEKIDLVKGAKEVRTFTKLGISLKDAKDFAIEQFLRCSSKNYYRGPNFDRDRCSEKQRNIWEFGFEVSVEDVTYEIYVKLKKRDDKGDFVFLSFHIAEYEIVYPFRN
ncbi:MAG: hypothetical protein ACE3K2_15165 [Paenibacillus sp.]|uniref:hypothetical protein n=1 Tax=Paenibacillus sp. TaxID=58172 RepID=UPI003B7620AD